MIQRPSGLVVSAHVDATARPAIALSELFDGSFTKPAPEDWERRLREISPIRSDMAHLRFRWFPSHPSWPMAGEPHSVDGMWMLYAWTPRHLVSADRAGQFTRHWSELPESQQPGRKALVSNYQFWVWHTHGCDAFPMWILQGDGGTPAKHTPAEVAFLDGSDLPSDPVPIGSLPPCAFDERSVRRIAARDRFVQACNDPARLAAMDSAAGIKAEDDAAMRLKRETMLDTWKVVMAPSTEFMKWYLGKSEADQALPRASKEQANAASQWRDHFVHTGAVLSARSAPSRRAHVLVQ